MMGMGEAPIGRALRALGLGGSVDRGAPTELSLVPPNPWPGDATRGRAMLGSLITLGGDAILAEGSAFSLCALPL